MFCLDDVCRGINSPRIISVPGVRVPFNAKTDYDPERYATFVDSLVSRTSSSLRNATDDIATRAAIRAFLEEGCAAGLTSEELIDFFCVDTPSIIDRAGITPARADEVVALFDQINDQLHRDRNEL